MITKASNEITQQKSLEILKDLDKAVQKEIISTHGDKAKIIYVPIFDNGEPYEDNYTYPETVCFDDYKQCVEWIEAQEEYDKKYIYSKKEDCWKLEHDKYNPYVGRIMFPFAFYTIHEMTLKEH